MRILIVEDDPTLADGLIRSLTQSGYAVDRAGNGQQAQHMLQDENYDLAILDLGLPGIDGTEVLRRLRQRGSRTPVLILTARDAVADRVAGLNAGGDDYVIKPFDLEELTARIHALLRRQSGRAEPVIQYGALRVDPVTHEVLLEGRSVPLSAREFTLLQAFLDRPGVVMSIPQLEEKMYGWQDEVGSNTVEVYIHALRKKLGADVIRNVRGVGYMAPRLP